MRLNKADGRERNLNDVMELPSARVYPHPLGVWINSQKNRVCGRGKDEKTRDCKLPAILQALFPAHVQQELHARTAARLPIQLFIRSVCCGQTIADGSASLILQSPLSDKNPIEI